MNKWPRHGRTHSHKQLSALISAFLFLLNILSPVDAGTLEFQGVPVDITTSDEEDLMIVPGEGGNTQIGDIEGTQSHAVANDDLYITGKLEVDAVAYLDGGVTSGNHMSPDVDSAYDLGSSLVRWRNIYADNLAGSLTFNSLQADADVRFLGTCLLYTSRCV